MLSEPFPHAGETLGSVVACGMVSETAVTREKESDVQTVNQHLVLSCQRTLSISSIAAGLSGRLRELDPDDMGEGPLDETDRRWAVAGEVAVYQLPLDNVVECAFSWPDAEGSAERYCERTTKASVPAAIIVCVHAVSLLRGGHHHQGSKDTENKIKILDTLVVVEV